MKCPKCGYNSFEFQDNCKKCNNDLISFKKIFGLKGVPPSSKLAPLANESSAIETVSESDAWTKQSAEAEQADVSALSHIETSPLQETDTSLPEFEIGLTKLQDTAESTSDFDSEQLSATETISDGGGEGYGDFSFEEMNNEPQSPQTSSEDQPSMDNNFADFLKSATSNETDLPTFSEQESPEFTELIQAGGHEAGLDSALAITEDGFEMEDFFINEEPDTKDLVNGSKVPQHKQDKDAFAPLFDELEDIDETQHK